MYAAFRRNLVPLRGKATGPQHFAWKGGTKISGHGYRLIWVDPLGPHGPMIASGMKANYVAEHRVVMAEALGRPLTSDETVHHINGDKLDNCRENLQLHYRQHGNTQRFVCQECGSCNVQAVSL